VTRKPLKVLVCLAIFGLIATASIAWGYNGTGLPGGTGIQGDALSADPSVQAAPSVRSGERTVTPKRSQSSTPTKHFPSTQSTTPARSVIQNPSVISMPQPVTPRARVSTPATPAWDAAYPVQASGQGSAWGGMCSPFAPSGLSFGSSSCLPYLPRVGCKQFQASARIWYTTLHSSTALWGVVPGFGAPGTELDLHQNLGLRKHEYTPEYEGRCQIRKNWGIRFDFMPIRYKDNFVANTPFYFGNLLWPAGLSLLTEWERNIYRLELVYDWYQGPHAVSSVFAGYRLHSDKLRVSYPPNAAIGQSRTRSEDMHLATSGISFDRWITKLGGCATASTHCQASIQYLEGYVGWDAYAVGRIAVPMDRGRYGYLEAGWRWIVLEINRPSNIDKTNLDGAIAAAGIIF
jgi:hypothetical protein